MPRGLKHFDTRIVCTIELDLLTMNKRINVILPATTVAVLDKVSAKGNRSALIDRAIKHYVKTQAQQNLRQRLKEEALAHAERDLLMAAEWFPLEEEASQTSHPLKRKR